MTQPGFAQGAGQQPRPQTKKPVYVANQQPPFVPGYKLMHHKGIQLFVTVEIEDQYLK